MTGRPKEMSKPDLDLARTVVVGTRHSGRKDFAAALARLLEAPLLDLQSLVWRPGKTESLPSQVEEALAHPAWVLAGNHESLRQVIWPRATAVIWLNYSYVTMIMRGLKNRIVPNGGPKEDRQPSGSWFHQIRHLLRAHRNLREEYGEIFGSRRYGTYWHVMVESPSAADDLLELVRINHEARRERDTMQ